VTARSKLLGYALLSWPPHVIGYVVMPLAVSRIGDHHGWSGDRPGLVNLPGILLIVAGAALIAWAIVSHYRSSADELLLKQPDYLVTTGAYAMTRNPLYAGGSLLWAGWAILFGSVAVVIGAALLFGGIFGLGIPYEERHLAQHFGTTYATYRSTTPRWLRLRRRGA
jgi:protein-S-isoprenylcysteine O-methyltransferase Ste14